MGYEAFIVSEASRQQLSAVFPPKNPLWIGHHVTHRFGVARTPNVPYGTLHTGWFEVIGYAEGSGIEALVVTVNGKEFRPDGKRYHLTWSLDPSQGKKPVDSNRLIAEGFAKIAAPIRFVATFDYVD